jgi:hypothetical protein
MSDFVEPPRKRRRWLLILGGLIVLLIGVQLWPRPLRPGPDTTRITGPLRADGSIDYAAALNEIGSKDVTPENNAAVLLVQAIGPAVIEPELQLEFFRKLGFGPLPVQGEYLQPLGAAYIANLDVLKRVQDEMEASYRAPWQPADHPELAQWLADNEQPLELCVAASERPRFYLPLVVPPGETFLVASLQQMQQMREIARMLSARVTLRLGAGDVEGALADVNALHRLSRLLGEHPLIISRLVAYALESMACRSDGVIIQSGLLTAEQARQQRAVLAGLPPFKPIADLIDQGERYVSLDAIYGQLNPSTWHPGRLNANVVYQRINAAYDESLAAMKRETLADQRSELTALAAKLRARGTPGWELLGRMLIGPRAAISGQVADTLAALLQPAFEQALIADTRTRLKQQLTLVGYALSEYKAVHGAYPDNLGALVPDLLERLPADPFGEEPIRYVLNAERGTFLLYGVGPNGKDDQGWQSGGGDDVGFGDVPEK